MFVWEVFGRVLITRVQEVLMNKKLGSAMCKSPIYTFSYRCSTMNDVVVNNIHFLSCCCPSKKEWHGCCIYMYIELNVLSISKLALLSPLIILTLIYNIGSDAKSMNLCMG